MNQIVLFGNRQDREIGALLKSYLQRDCSVYHLTDDSMTVAGGGEPIFLLESEFLSKLQLPTAVLILKKKACAEQIQAILEGTVVIVDASDTDNISVLSQKHPSVQVYTCGFGEKNAVTFSSREDHQAVVSLQRPILMDNELFCEPFEIPCEVNRKLADYSILATVMALILIRKCNENKSKESGKIYFSY